MRSNTNDNEVYLLGTAHVSDASAREVVDLIRLVRPQAVFVELDSMRAAQLRSNGSMAGGLADPAMLGALRNMIPSQMKQSFEQILEAAPALLKRIGWMPMGGEMKAALDEADQLGIRCVYGDVEFSQTTQELKRAVTGMAANPAQFANIRPPPGELAAAFSGLLSDPRGFVETIKTRERARQMTRYLRQCFPPVYHAMIGRRDAHMAKMLRRHCHNGKVVAVVGMAHVEGIERAWEDMDAEQ